LNFRIISTFTLLLVLSLYFHSRWRSFPQHGWRCPPSKNGHSLLSMLRKLMLCVLLHPRITSPISHLQFSNSFHLLIRSKSCYFCIDCTKNSRGLRACSRSLTCTRSDGRSWISFADSERTSVAKVCKNVCSILISEILHTFSSTHSLSRDCLRFVWHLEQLPLRQSKNDNHGVRCVRFAEWIPCSVFSANQEETGINPNAGFVILGVQVSSILTFLECLYFNFF